jgi:hypothetical protein
MTDSKNNIFAQLYGPLNNTEPQNPQPDQASSLSPESAPFSVNNSSEYTPIMEYVEPQIDVNLAEHVQTSNPPFQPAADVPLMPISTPIVPGIQPMQLPSVPLTEIEIEAELKTNVFTAIRWLAEWCLRQVQIHHQKEADNTI